MSRASRPTKQRSRSRRGNRWRKLWPSAQKRKRWWRRFRKLDPWTQLALAATATLVVWLGVNFVYQVIRKPTELFFPVSGVLNKTPAATWTEYESIFRRHSTDIMTPELLAALTQTEGSGNPIARTYWRWSLTSKPFEVYKPASSAVGMYQITDGTFEQARRLCIHDHQVVDDGPWHDWRSCWFNWTYLRISPSDSVELTSAYLHRQVAMLTQSRPASVAQKQILASVIHLCGAGAGAGYARRGFRFLPGQRCGDHHAAAYTARVTAMQRQFQRLSAQRDAE